VASACQLVVGLERQRSDDESSSPDAGPDVPVAADAGRTSPCADEPPPPPKRPVVDDHAPTITLVLSNAAFGGDDAGAALCPSAGFDLDDRMTCIDEAGASTPSPCSTGACASSCTPAAGARVCDGPHGVDNAISLLVGDRGALSSLLDGRYQPSEFVTSGTANILFTITGYNGEADDPDVSVSSYFSTGLEDRGRSRTSGDAGEPGWDGRTLRRWAIDPASFDANGFARLGQFPGYVSGHVLVAVGARLQIPFGPMVLDLYDGRLTGELRRREDGLWNIAYGRVGGRVDTDQLVDVIARAPFQTGSGVVHVCEKGEAALVSMRGFICGRADLASDGGPEAHCNELSFGLGFTAVPAILGRLRERDVSELGCPGQTFAGCP